MRNILSWRRLGLVFGVALLTLGAVQISQAQKAPFPNWSGFEVTSQKYNYIATQWTVPAVTFVNYGSSASQEKASVWIGLGGISGNLLQAGTDSTVTSTGSTTYTAWFQTVPDAGIDSDPLTGCHMLSGPSSVPCTVAAGDTIDVEIICNYPPLDSCPSWTTSIIDETQSWAWGNGSINFAPDQSSAEFIVEAPKVLQGGVRTKLPLPNFGTLAFKFSGVAPNESFTTTGNGDTMKDPSGGCANPTGASYDGTTKSWTLTVAYAFCAPKPFVGIYNTHDVNGDGMSDIVWGGSTCIAVWEMNAAQVLNSGCLGAIPASWSIVGQRDFNGDGNADLLWRDSSGNLAFWFLNGATVTAAAGFGNVPTNWSIYGTGDFNHDGTGDILWRDSNTGTVAIWFINAGQLTSAASLGAVPASWSIVGSDAIGDILWRDTSGNVALWSVNGSQIVQSVGLGNVPPNWQVVGLGDFNGDGFVDILWQDTSGDVAVWLLSNGQVTQSAIIGTVPSTWSIQATGDYDGNGTSDILWRDSSGNVAIWFMNGTQVSSSAGVGNVPTTWTIQNANAD